MIEKLKTIKFAELSETDSQSLLNEILALDDNGRKESLLFLIDERFDDLNLDCAFFRVVFTCDDILISLKNIVSDDIATVKKANQEIRDMIGDNPDELK